jgi:hypothetical protein
VIGSKVLNIPFQRSPFDTLDVVKPEVSSISSLNADQRHSAFAAVGHADECTDPRPRSAAPRVTSSNAVTNRLLVYDTVGNRPAGLL